MLFNFFFFVVVSFMVIPAEIVKYSSLNCLRLDRNATALLLFSLSIVNIIKK